MKKLFLIAIFSVLLTSCVSVKQISYLNNSTSFDKSNQEIYLKLLNDINTKYVYINNLTEFDEYLSHLNTLSEFSYNYIKDSEKISEKNISIEIDLQKKILRTLKNFSVKKELFASEDAYNAGKKFISEYLIKLIDTRLNYLEIILENMENNTSSSKSHKEILNSAPIPNIELKKDLLSNNYLNINVSH